VIGNRSVTQCPILISWPRARRFRVHYGRQSGREKQSADAVPAGHPLLGYWVFQPMISISCGLLKRLRLQNNTTKIGREFPCGLALQAPLHRGELPLIKQAMPQKMVETNRLALSLGETRLNVVLTQFKLSALSKTGIAAKKTKATKENFLGLLPGSRSSGL
jgi:hypothetical protein